MGKPQSLNKVHLDEYCCHMLKDVEEDSVQTEDELDIVADVQRELKADLEEKGSKEKGSKEVGTEEKGISDLVVETDADWSYVDER